jgi:integrase
MSVARNSSNRRPRGDGSIFYDDTRGRWVGSLDLGAGPDGKRRRVKVSADTETDVAKKLRQLQAKAAAGVDVSGQRITVGELFDRWLSDVAPLRQGAKSLDISSTLIRTRLRPAFGHMKATAVRPDDVEAFLRAMADDGLARSTVTKLRGILVQVFRLAEQRRIITWNPARLAYLPPVDATVAPRDVVSLDADQTRALLAAARGHRLEVLLAMAVTLAMRPGELGALQWADVDFDAGTVTVHQALKWSPTGPTIGTTKTGKRRTLAMPAELAALLLEHRRRQAVERDVHGAWPAEWTGLVFTTSTGAPHGQRNLRRDVRALGKKAGVENLTPYGLRHTACSVLSADGVSLELLADVLGHQDTRMVMRHYRHVTAPSVTAALATGSRLLALSQGSHR